MSRVSTRRGREVRKEVAQGGLMWCVSKTVARAGVRRTLTSRGMDLPAIRWRSAGTFSMSSATSAACFSPPICNRQTATPYVYVDFDHYRPQDDAALATYLSIGATYDNPHILRQAISERSGQGEGQR